MRRVRVLLWAALCLCVHLPAPAVADEPRPATPAELSVSATLDRCGQVETGIACGIDVAFDPLPGAVRYAVSITRPDGSVVDYGTVDAGSATVWVPYAGKRHLPDRGLRLRRASGRAERRR